MIDQLILKLIRPIAECTQECEAKQLVRSNVEQFDEEQKVQYAHTLCHMYGALSLLFKIVVIAFITQTIIVSIFFRLK